MTFADLYGTELDTQLGTTDRTQRFTTARRKSEVNAGMREFNRLTSCYVRRGSITLVDDTGEYDLIAGIGATLFLRLAPDQLPVVKRSISSDITYLAGKDLPRRSPDWLDDFSPGWRDADAGTPEYWYTRDDDGDLMIGLTPPPSIEAADAGAWLLLVPYVAEPTAMSADADVPFTTAAEVKVSLTPFHPALAHYAAAKLELLRKNTPASDRQMQIFGGYVTDYLQSRAVAGPQHVVLARDYLGEANKMRDNFDVRDPRR